LSSNDPSIFLSGGYFLRGVLKSSKIFYTCNHCLIKDLRTNDNKLLKISYFILDICDSDDSNSRISFVVCKVGMARMGK
jgi:hypothetical protein